MAQRRYWLFKSEPSVYPFEQLVADRRTHWDGIRNYQARNILRDEVRKGDGVLFYHSNANPMCVAGVAKVVREAYPDPSAWDPQSRYFDPKSDPDDPAWLMVDIAPVAAFAEPVTRDTLKGMKALEGMMLLQRGARLSIQPVTAAQWKAILREGGVEASW